MSDSKRFSGKVAVVTGAAGNIGLATALRLAREGARIALMDVDEGKLAATLPKFEALGAEARTYPFDVTDPGAVSRAIGEVVQAFGGIDLLFNNAGYQGAFTPIQDYPEDDFERVLKINLCGAFYVLKACARQMMTQGGGAIVNTASMAGIGGPPNMLGYASSKFGIVGLTQTASKDLAPHKIRVNAISPGLMGPGFMWDRQVELQAKAGSQYFSSDPKEVAQQMIGSVPMRRYGDIEEIPGVVAFLLSDDASYLTGVNIPISGGIL
jgi:2-dehydro-3-deoxy-L-rhamnonate dehydrogenase (NAD+)